ncbi:cation:proton antiporter domain-containing protein [Maricaulaceae bacterium MS644]
MEAGGGHDVWLKDAAVFLLAAGVVVPLFKRVRLSAVLGFLIAGVLLGPYVLGAMAERWPVLEWVTVSDPEAAAPFAELGVLFLLFLLGLELSFQRLWALRRAVFGAGGLQAGLSAAAIGSACVLIGLTAPVAVVIGLALALSSTAIVMQILAEERRSATPLGRASLAVLLMQDILVAPFLITVGFLARDAGADEQGVTAVIIEALVQGLVAIAIIVLIGRYVLKRAFRLVAKVGGRDLMMAITLATLVGAALLTKEAGLSLALGAFLAGLLLGETEFKHQAEVDLEPFKGLLLGVFFTTVGIGLDLGAVAQNLILVFGGLAAMLVLKFAIVYAACRLFAGNGRLALEAGFLLAPAGEFAFVILAAAAAGAIIDPQTQAIVAAIAGLSMLLTPALARIGAALSARLAPAPDTGPAMADFSDLEGHVIIAGMGRVGRAIGRVLETEGVEVLALDRNAMRVARARRDGWRAYYGDAADPEILKKAGAAKAELFAVSVDDPDKACAVVAAIRDLRSDAVILARARDGEHAARLTKAGATHVTLEAIEAALALAGRALEGFGLSPETVRDRLAQERDDEYARADGKGE